MPNSTRIVVVERDPHPHKICFFRFRIQFTLKLLQSFPERNSHDTREVPRIVDEEKFGRD